MNIDKNLHWILSFYRTSEISGALFFGELARSLRPSAIQQDMTRHLHVTRSRHRAACEEQLHRLVPAGGGEGAPVRSSGRGEGGVSCFWRGLWVADPHPVPPPFRGRGRQRGDCGWLEAECRSGTLPGFRV